MTTILATLAAAILSAAIWASPGDDDMKKCEKTQSPETCQHEVMP